MKDKELAAVAYISVVKRLPLLFISVFLKKAAITCLSAPLPFKWNG